MRCLRQRERGFTLLELLLVLVIFIALASLVGTRTNTYYLYKQKALLRNLLAHISFIHSQAAYDGAF
ncbi:MAG: prepilin-type N-terminal cleavage/methylation domain-containing protein, partial [Candidatus Dadabacteria bacterium]